MNIWKISLLRMFLGGIMSLLATLLIVSGIHSELATPLPVFLVLFGLWMSNVYISELYTTKVGKQFYNLPNTLYIGAAFLLMIGGAVGIFI
jgi:hypothetical protein